MDFKERCFLAICFLLSSPLLLQAESYTSLTIAGLAEAPGFADGTNSSARFNQPLGVATDRAGNVFVVDWNNAVIRKLTPAGTNWVISTIAGSPGITGSADGTNGDARFNFPVGIAADDAGNLFVADTGNFVVRKLAFSGTNCIVTTIAGQSGVFASVDGTNSDAKFKNPFGVTVDRTGYVYVADVASDTIRRLAPVGTNWVSTTIAGLDGSNGSTDGTNSDARFFGPFDVASDVEGNLYVPDYENQTIRKLSPLGTNWVVSTIAGSVGNSGYADGTNDSARFSFPRGVAVDGLGNVYVADTGTDTIRRLTQVGTNWFTQSLVGLPWRWGYADGTGTKAQFNVPERIALDRQGNIFLSDPGNQVILKLYPPPSPQIALLGNRIVLSWPSWGGDFYLETSPALAGGALWTALTNGVTISGGSLVLTNDARDAVAFYRLGGPSR